MSAVKTRPKVTATGLAWLAEGAHGRQGTTMYIYREDDGNIILSDEDPGPDKECVVEVETRTERPPLLRAHKIAVQVKKNGLERNLLNDPKLPHCDALFWSASSIEKFLFPYYHAQRLYSQQEICRLMESYNRDENLVGAAHVAPSKPRKISALDSAGFLSTDGDRSELQWIGFTEYLRR